MQKLNILNSIEKTDLFNKLRTSLTHHSNAIEGLSLTFGETRKLLEQGITANNKPLHEQLVILGFADAFDFVTREASNSSGVLTTDLIKDTHSILFNKAMSITPERIDKPIGAWRTDERYIKGVDIKLSPPSFIKQDIENLLYKYPKEMRLEDIAIFHIDFERIHPFCDGNGRVGRLLITYQAIRNNYIPPLILNEHRKDYLNSLSNYKAFTKFLEQSMQNSLQLLNTKKLNREYEI